MRIIFDPPVDTGNESEKVLDAIVRLGCSYEGASPSCICIDIPAEVDFDVVRDFMIENNVNIEYADPSYEELFGTDEKDD